MIDQSKNQIKFKSRQNLKSGLKPAIALFLILAVLLQLALAYPAIVVPLIALSIAGICFSR